MQTVCCAIAISTGLLVMGCFCSIGCSKSTEELDVDPRITSANTGFGFRLFEELVEQSPDANVFISPVSVAIALEMTYNGAQGETQQAMAEALKLEGMSLRELNRANAALIGKLKSLDDDILLNIANSLWARKGEEFRPDFMKRNQDFYQAHIETLDFSDPQAPSVINAWVKEETQGKIEDMVNAIPGGMVLYLINAVYFKGSWAVRFDERYTRERDFTLLDGSKKKVPMMITKSDQFGRFQGDGFQGVSLPYGDGEASMYIFLPDRDSSLEDFYRRLDAGNWEDWVSQFHTEEVQIILPRFRLEYEAILNNALSKLGMGVAFDSSKADFGGICAGKCWIDEVKHKAFVEVNEEGTEAAAATSVSLKKGGPIPVIVDRPFFCAIRDNDTGSVLFMGSVVEP